MAKCIHDFCGQEAGENNEDGFCILHSQSENKDRVAFEAALDARSGPKDNFSYIAFPPDFDFSNRMFRNPVFFQTTFLGNVSFRNTIFGNMLDFKHSAFNGTAFFYKATFAGEVDFRDAQFLKDARFREAKFKGGANFQGVAFPEQADFFHAEFGEAGNNSDPKVTKYANFSQATFAKKADFTCIRLLGVKADFRDVEFSDVAIFFGVEFANEKDSANFLNSRFGKEANFVRASFPQEAQFTSATFEKGAIFDGTTFEDWVVFDGARFLGRTLFEPERRKGQERIFSGAEVFFTNVTLDPLDAVTFRDADLSKCRFQGTDLRELEITNAEWPKIPRPFPLSPRRLGVYDDVAPPGRDETRDWSHIERVYRELKQNYEDRRDYERASDFHFGEKEIRRKNPKTSPGLKFLLIAYWLVCGYGERWIRPFIWMLILFGLSTLGYLTWGLNPKPECAGAATTNVLDYLNYSLRVMTLLKPDDLVPIGWAKYVNTAESLLGPLLIGLFALALRQRLKR